MYFVRSTLVLCRPFQRAVVFIYCIEWLVDCDDSPCLGAIVTFRISRIGHTRRDLPFPVLPSLSQDEAAICRAADATEVPKVHHVNPSKDWSDY